MLNSTQAAGDRPYPQRTEKLPSRVDEVDAAWLTRQLQNRYPGLVVENMQVVKLINTHTTKMRLALLDHLRSAGLDRQYGPVGAERTADERALLHRGGRSRDPQGAGKLTRIIKAKGRRL